MQVFAQKSVLVVSIYFPLIALINTDISCFRANPCSSVVGIISPCALRRHLNYLNLFS